MIARLKSCKLDIAVENLFFKVNLKAEEHTNALDKLTMQGQRVVNLNES